jgi:hypothetical protein
MEWTKFKNRLPEVPSNYAIYVTDYKSVWISYLVSVDSWDTYSQTYPENGWSQIPLPEIPKKELHFCKSVIFDCFENDEGNLVLKHPSYTAGVFCLFCPFCGYSPKNSNSP